MRYWLVMPAAGVGRRFGGPKQFAVLGGRTVLDLALQPFIEDVQCQGGVVALAADEPRRAELGARVPARFILVDGGATRAESVLKAWRPWRPWRVARRWMTGYWCTTRLARV